MFLILRWQLHLKFRNLDVGAYYSIYLEVLQLFFKNEEQNYFPIMFIHVFLISRKKKY